MTESARCLPRTTQGDRPGCRSTITWRALLLAAFLLAPAGRASAWTYTTVDGTVKYCDGTALANVKIDFVKKGNLSSQVEGSATTGSDGRYSISLRATYGSTKYDIYLPNGTYTFSSDGGNPFTCWDGKKTVNLTVSKGPVKGKVKCGTRAVQGVSVTGGGKSATTDEDGEYVLDAVDKIATVSPSKTGFTFSPGSRSARPGQSGMDFSLTCGPIGGTVHAGSFSASVVGGVTMTLDNGGTPVLVTTAWDGSFQTTVDTSPSGTYTVEASRPGCTISPFYSAHVGQTELSWTVQSAPIGGRVATKAGGEGLVGLTVTAQRADGAPATTTTDGNGYFFIPHLASGSYTVSVESDSADETFTPVTVSATPGTTDLLFVARETIRGVVYSGNTNNGLAGKTVTASTGTTVVASAVTDVKGAYTLTDLPVDTYTVRVQNPNMAYTPTAKNVSPPEEHEQNFAATVLVGGRVTHEGDPVANVNVTWGAFVATTDANGKYTLTLTGYAAGGTNNADLSVASPSPYDFELGTPVPPGATFTAPGSISLLPLNASMTNLNIAAAGKIAGQVVYRDGEYAVGIPVTADNGTESATAYTDASGNFVIAGLPRGSYTVTPAAPGFAFVPASRIAATGTDGCNFLVGKSPPSMTPIGNQFVAMNGHTHEIPFTVDDHETEPGLLLVTVDSDSLDLLPPGSYTLGGAGTSFRTLQIAPASNQTGRATVSVVILDGDNAATTNMFMISVGIDPRFRVIGFGPLSGCSWVLPADINQKGQVVGHGVTPGTYRHKAFLYTGLAAGGGLQDLTDVLAGASGMQAELHSINNAGVVGGHWWDSGSTSYTVYYDLDTLTATRATTTLNNSAYKVGINDDGKGIRNTERYNAATRTFSTATRHAIGISEVNELFVLGSNAKRFEIRTLAGDALIADVNLAANIDYLTSFYETYGAINNSREVVGVGYVATGRLAAWKYTPGEGAWELEDFSKVYDINNAGQIVGVDTGGSNASLYMLGKTWDLNALIPYDEGWDLVSAAAINDDGMIAGRGYHYGVSKGFVAIPVVDVGRAVSRPIGALASKRPPEVQAILEGDPDATPANSFLWCSADNKLYSLRPVTARVSWPVNNDPSDLSNRVVNVVLSVWPDEPQIHVAGTPIELEPPELPGFGYRYLNVPYTSLTGTRVDVASKTFTMPGEGWSVIRYTQTPPGAQADALRNPILLQVVRTISWDDEDYVRVQAWNVGQTLVDTNHVDYPGRNGFVLFEKTPYDGNGVHRAHDRATRTGPIIPVNRGMSGTTGRVDPMAVAWYRINPLGQAWSETPVRYDLQWPTNATVITIADQAGGPAFPELEYAGKHIYNQPDITRAGFNPNEEHALIVDDKPVALRCDLNPKLKLSDPYVLMKYRDPVSLEWTMQVFKVEPGVFAYLKPVGQEIQPPFPMNVLPLCAESEGVYGPWWEDVKGKLYAKAAGEGLADDYVVVRWYYPLQPGFFYDLDGDDANDVADGTALPLQEFLGTEDLPPRSPGDPINAYYNVHWPRDIKTLQVGSSLSKARDGLPEINAQARAEIIFEAVNPPSAPGYDPLDSAARIYDPLSERSGRIPDTLTFSYLASQLRMEDYGFRKQFTDLPYVIRDRLLYDPQMRKLVFRGVQVYREQPSGAPLVLPNVMSDSERAAIVELLPNKTAWSTTVRKLYELTRNPNEVDADGDGVADDALRTGLITQYVVMSNGTATVQTGSGINPPANAVRRTVIPESFGGGPKTLTAALPLTDKAATRLSVTGPSVALQFDGVDDCVDSGVWDVTGDQITLAAWIRPDVLDGSHVIICKSVDAEHVAPYFRFCLYQTGTRLAMRIGDWTGATDVGALTTGVWQHVAGTYDGSNARLFVNGVREYGSGTLAVQFVGSPRAVSIGGRDTPLTPGGPYFQGAIDEVALWTVARSRNEIRADMTNTLSGLEIGLAGYWRFDEVVGAIARDASGHYHDATLVGGPTRTSRDTTVPQLNGYIALAFNNDADLPGLPVTLSVIAVDTSQGPYTGNIRVLPSDNVFDERLTLRHDGDFGGQPGDFAFEWYYYGGSDDPGSVPLNGVGQLNAGWAAYTPGADRNQVTLGKGGESGLLVISDARWYMRYRGYSNVFGDQWSAWVGAPNKVPTEPQLAEGWVKRVTQALNPLDARVDDFRNSEINTYASALVAAGTRYEGDIAFNPDADNINNIGLIEAYETVLRRARDLSISSSPPQNYGPANDALLLAATKIADLYMLLGNEAYGDAQDPTIGFTTADGSVGTLAPSIFAFQNQLDSLLQEELVLLRGRDVNLGAPVYNRLIWNFTGGEGQLAYKQVYNIYDTFNAVTGSRSQPDGFIDSGDAAVLYPQGHGDAWGHYVTALTAWYNLMANPNFEWRSRAESILLAGIPITVDYLDERKFASAAAARARAGRDIVDLTYRDVYTDIPSGQWQGYKDTDTQRAWGMTEWTRRAGHAAYFDWVVGNAILPAVDPDPSHEGIQKVDRTTVTELREIVSLNHEIQQRADVADNGLNPLGLAKGAIPFDIDPNFDQPGSGVEGMTHFEQIETRAVDALQNAVRVFNHANELTQNLRRTQDSAAEFEANVQDQESDYRNRLIEIFGYPYEGDIGPGKPYASGYEGPDLVHYMYVDASALTGETLPDAESLYGSSAHRQFTGFYTGVEGNHIADLSADEELLAERSEGILEVNYPLSSAAWPFAAPQGWGQRRAPGQIQMAVSDLLQARASFEQALREYDNLITEIMGQVAGLQMKYDLEAERIRVLNKQRNTLESLSGTILTLQAAQFALNMAEKIVDEVGETVIEGLPKCVGTASDVTSTARATVRSTTSIATTTLSIISDATALAQSAVEMGKEAVGLQTEIELQTLDSRYEVLQELWTLETMMRDEIPKRVALFNLQEVLVQTRGNYYAKVAEGVRLLDARETFRKRAAGHVSSARYSDLTFRIFRNDAIQKYRAQFDLAARYVYLAAMAYDYETTFLGAGQGSGSRFIEEIVRQRALGEVIDGQPLAGRHGLADSLARLGLNFDVLKGQLGFNNPELETGLFSLRQELFRQRAEGANTINVGVTEGFTWRDVLQSHRVANIWAVPEFRRFCRSFAPESLGPQPGLVIPFTSTVTFGLNYFGWPLAGGESSYDPTYFATKVRSLGVSFVNYPQTRLSATPRIYLIPVGTDILRAAAGNTLDTREYKVIDQKIPVPFPIGSGDLSDPEWIPMVDSLNGSLAEIRQFSSFRAYPADTLEDVLNVNPITSSRLIGRSVWNTQWLVIIPGGTLLNDADAGLDIFIDTVEDIALSFRTYSYSGN